MNKEHIIAMIEERKQRFINWKLESDFIDGYRESIVEKHFSTKNGAILIGITLSYFVSTWAFFSYFNITFNSSMLTLFIMGIVFISYVSFGLMNRSIRKKADKEINALIKSGKIYSACEEKCAPYFYDQRIDEFLKKDIEIALNNEEWKALRTYTRDRMTYKNVLAFLSSQSNNVMIENKSCESVYQTIEIPDYIIVK